MPTPYISVKHSDNNPKLRTFIIDGQTVSQITYDCSSPGEDPQINKSQQMLFDALRGEKKISYFLLEPYAVHIHITNYADWIGVQNFVMEEIQKLLQNSNTPTTPKQENEDLPRPVPSDSLFALKLPI